MISPVFAQQQPEKCGTFQYVERFSQAKRFQIEFVSVPRPALQKSILTSNGKIRIHYDTSGINEPAMVNVQGNRIPNSYQQFIDTLRIILDSVWKAEIDVFGFIAPPSDDNRDGGNEYDFYVMELGGGLFGETVPEYDLPMIPNKTNQQYPSYIRIDNDFGIGYRTKGIPAVMATTAHEFHHAIQVGGSGLWEDKYFYFYEICAEAMENTVFRDAKDYIFDVKTYYTNISSTSLFQQNVSFSTAGYERAIWGMFLMKKYGTNVMKEIWNEIKTNRPVLASNNALNTFSTSLQREFADFSFWNFYTAHRADSIKYFSDAKLFPPVALQRSVIASASIEDVQMNTKSFTINYIKASVPTDSAFFIVSNTNYNDALNYTQQVFPFQISISSSSSSGFPLISNSVYAKFSAPDPQNWSYIPVGVSPSPLCFPNPLNPSTSSLLISIQGIGVGSDVTLSIFSASTMDLVYSNSAKYTTFSGTQFAEWKGRDDKGSVVSSGVYVYVLSKGSNVIKGKFGVIR